MYWTLGNYINKATQCVRLFSLHCPLIFMARKEPLKTINLICITEPTTSLTSVDCFCFFNSEVRSRLALSTDIFTVLFLRPTAKVYTRFLRLRPAGASYPTVFVWILYRTRFLQWSKTSFTIRKRFFINYSWFCLHSTLFKNKKFFMREI